jgi:hypothetical protein
MISSRMEKHPRIQRSSSLNQKIAIGKLRTGAHSTKKAPERERARARAKQPEGLGRGTVVVFEMGWKLPGI